jgi:hypothetical protein
MVVEVSLKHIPMRSQVCFDAATEGVTGRLLWPALRCPTDAVSHPHPYGVGLSAIRAAAAPVGGFPLLALLVYVANEYPTIYARVGAPAFET